MGFGFNKTEAPIYLQGFIHNSFSKSFDAQFRWLTNVYSNWSISANLRTKKQAKKYLNRIENFHDYNIDLSLFYSFEEKHQFEINYEFSQIKIKISIAKIIFWISSTRILG